MSASLVGSEMCIRDRGQPQANPGQPGVIIWPILALASGAQQRDDPGPTPVSYTHLTLPTICSV
eukprot:2165544-Alexandrium_andersonii.AAC.1